MRAVLSGQAHEFFRRHEFPHRRRVEIYRQPNEVFLNVVPYFPPAHVRGDHDKPGKIPMDCRDRGRQRMVARERPGVLSRVKNNDHRRRLERVVHGKKTRIVNKEILVFGVEFYSLDMKGRKQGDFVLKIL